MNAQSNVIWSNFGLPRPRCNVCGKEFVLKEHISPVSGKSLWLADKSSHEQCMEENDRRESEAKKLESLQWKRSIIDEAFEGSGINWSERTFLNWSDDKRNDDSFDEVLKWKYPEQGIYLHGPSGSGKTHLLSGLVVYHFQNNCADAKVVQWRSWYRDVSQLPWAETKPLLEKAKEVSLLAIDEFFVGNLTANAEEILLELLNFRLEFRKPTVMSSNISPAQFDKLLTERVANRLRQLMRFVAVDPVGRK